MNAVKQLTHRDHRDIVLLTIVREDVIIEIKALFLNLDENAGID